MGVVESSNPHPDEERQCKESITPDTHSNITKAIQHLENKYAPHEGTFAHYAELTQWKHLPMLDLIIDSKALPFLVDSGATNSVLMAKHYPNVKLSGRFMRSMTAAGVVVREQYTMPIRCEDPGGSALKHSFLLSGVAPFNLLGRDLMCKYGLNIESTPEGLIVTRAEVDSFTMVKYNRTSPKYIYQYDLIPTAIGSINQLLIDKAKERVTHGAQFMDPDDLH